MSPLGIQDLIHLLLGLLPASAGLRCVLCLIRINTDPDQAQVYRKRLRNTLVFFAVAQCAMLVLLYTSSKLS